MRGIERPARRMSGIMGSIHEGYAMGDAGDGGGRGGVGGGASGRGEGMGTVGDIADDYVGDFATTFDSVPTGYTPLGLDPNDPAIANIQEGATTADAQLQARLLSPDPTVRQAALNDGIAAGTVMVAATPAQVQSSWFTPANIGKAVLVGNALYHIAQTPSGIQAVPAQQSMFGNMSPVMLIALAGAAFLILKG